MKIIPGTHLASSYSKSRTFAGGRGGYMLSGQLRGHEGSFHIYKQCKKDTTSAIRKAHNEYVEHKLIRGLEEGSTKPFWRYVKSLRRDNSGISPLKQDGKLHNDSKDKAEILNNQFKSVFTQPSASEIPEPQGPRAPI